MIEANATICKRGVLAFAPIASATLSAMDADEKAEFRIERLKAAIVYKTEGNRSAFGRLLGYEDGAFIRQMLSGKRPITEKTIDAIEALPGMAKWFSPETKFPADALHDVSLSDKTPIETGPLAAHHVTEPVITVTWEWFVKSLREGTELLADGVLVVMPDDSMAGRIDKGDSVFLKMATRDNVKPGDIVLVRCQGEYMLRGYRHVLGDTFEVYPMNAHSYPTLRHPDLPLEIIGKATQRIQSLESA